MYLEKSSVKVSRYLLPPFDSTCIGPHTSLCIISYGLVALRWLCFGKGFFCILPRTQASQSFWESMSLSQFVPLNRRPRRQYEGRIVFIQITDSIRSKIQRNYVGTRPYKCTKTNRNLTSEKPENQLETYFLTASVMDVHHL